MVDAISEPHSLMADAVAAAKALAALPPAAFALTKLQIRRPAIERAQRDAAEIERIWTAPETLERVRDYVRRTLRKP